MVKNLPTNAGDEGNVGLIVLGQEDPLEDKMATHFSVIAGKSHGQRSLVGYSLWSHRVILMAKNVCCCCKHTYMNTYRIHIYYLWSYYIHI